MSLENEINRLRMAVDRQGRAATSEDWLADQAVIDHAKAAIDVLGGDSAAEEQRAGEQDAK